MIKQWRWPETAGFFRRNNELQISVWLTTLLYTSLSLIPSEFFASFGKGTYGEQFQNYVPCHKFSCELCIYRFLQWEYFGGRVFRSLATKWFPNCNVTWTWVSRLQCTFIPLYNIKIFIQAFHCFRRPPMTRKPVKPGFYSALWI